MQSKSDNFTTSVVAVEPDLLSGVEMILTGVSELKTIVVNY